MVDKETRKYLCGYCGNEFKQEVRKVGEGKTAGSTQVKCRDCGNFLKTWE